MKPRTLSASAIKAYEACPAMYRAKYILRDPDPPGDPALRGTVVHAVLENWVAGGFHLPDLSDGEKVDKIDELVELHYWQHFSHGNEYEFCVEQCRRWVQRTDFTGREVLSTERKYRFELPTSRGKIPVSYIIDRTDRLEGGDIEGVDYKTWVRNITVQELRWDLQSRIYALALWIQYREANRIWITFDQTRFRDIGVAFSQEDCKHTWRYLKNVAERILADDGTEERLNSECRWCPRKRVCSALKRHEKAGGRFADHDIAETAKRRHEVASQVKALEVFLDELDGHLLAYAEAEGEDDFELDGVVVQIASKGSRSVDQKALVGILGEDTARFVEAYGGLTMTAIDKMLKDRNPWLEPEVQMAIEGLVEDKFAGLRVNTNELSPILTAVEA